jgi:hypothetical protein
MRNEREMMIQLLLFDLTCLTMTLYALICSLGILFVTFHIWYSRYAVRGIWMMDVWFVRRKAASALVAEQFNGKRRQHRKELN